MGRQVTLNFPLGITSFDAAGNGVGPRGLAPLTPNANNQVTVDAQVYPIDLMLASGFTLAPLVTTTANRPTVNLSPGLLVIDSTLNQPIWRDATNTKWISAAGATV